MTFRSSLVASPRRARNSARSREKEKPAKFANGSLLGNDSRIFVEHHGAYPLSRMRLSFSPVPLSPRRFPSAHFSFSKFYRPETPGVLSSLHFLLCPFSDLWRFPSCHDALYFRFCLYFRFPFLRVSLRFLQRQRIHRPDRRVFVHSILFVLPLLFFFFSFTLSPFLSSRDFVTCPLSLSITEFCTSPLGIVLRFLRRRRLQLVQRADTIARIKPFVQFHFSRWSR